MYNRPQPWPAMMSRRTVAAYLDLAESQVSQAVLAGHLPSASNFLGGQHWSKDDIDSAIAAAIASADATGKLREAALVAKPCSKSLVGSDPIRLAGIGKHVRTQLKRDARVRQIDSAKVELFEMDGLLTSGECLALMALIDADLRPSATLAAAPDPGFRTSQTCYLPDDHALVADLDQRFSKLLGIPLSHSETAQGQRYTTGQHFKPHQDYFHPGQSWSATVAKEGGQRTWTAMVFLNKPEEGGCTDFPDVPVTIVPSAGKLLTWNNMDHEGLPNPSSRHEGTAVKAGSKYVITKWFREREWRAASAE